MIRVLLLELLDPLGGVDLDRKIAAGRYEVDHREFPDGHVVPPDLAREAFDRFLGG